MMDCFSEVILAGNRASCMHLVSILSDFTYIAIMYCYSSYQNKGSSIVEKDCIIHQNTLNFINHIKGFIGLLAKVMFHHPTNTPRRQHAYLYWYFICSMFPKVVLIQTFSHDHVIILNQAKEHLKWMLLN